MADVNIHEQGTFPAQHIVDDYFDDLPTDSRFTSTEYRQFVSHTAVDKNSETIEFVLERLNAPYCYMLADALMSVTVHITKSDGVALPEATAKVGPVNNVIGSLFERMTMRINDDEVSPNGDYYGYKCYLKKLLSFDNACKGTQFLPSGWVDDTSGLIGNIEPHDSNAGWKARGNLFRKNFRAGNEFRPEGATFIGPFVHDLSNVTKAMPPGIKDFFLNLPCYIN
jgi:hypothetical protein